MISITHFPDSIPEYVRKGKDNFFPPIYGCLCCSYNGKLHRHGFYPRNVISFSGNFTIYIARKICPVCGHTYSQIPDFLIPYFQYSYQVILTTLTLIFLKKLSYLQILNQLRQQNSLFLSKQHLTFYRRRFTKSRFINHLFFAQKKEFYYDMDFNKFDLPQFLHSLTSKIHNFSKLYQNFNLSYFKIMPYYFFYPYSRK